MPAKLEPPKLSAKEKAEIEHEIERARRAGQEYNRVDVYDLPAHPPFRILGITAEVLLPDTAYDHDVRYVRNFLSGELWGDPKANKVIVERVRFPGEPSR